MGAEQTKCCARSEAAPVYDDEMLAVPEMDAIRMVAGKVTPEQILLMKEDLKRVVQIPGMRAPVRSFLNDQDYVWRTGKPPDYDLANYTFLTGKSMMHPEGSLAMVVEDLVKTWEFERSHKMDSTMHKSVDQEKFLIGANGNKMFGNVEANDVGNYNVLLNGVDEKLWTPNQTWDESHHSFKDAFVAFPWEVLKVFSGPPCVAFSWRHWAEFTGTYKGNQGKGEVLNMYGWATAVVAAGPDGNLLLNEVNVYYKPEDFLLVMEGKAPANSLSPDSILSTGAPTCPVTGQQGKCAGA